MAVLTYSGDLAKLPTAANRFSEKATKCDFYLPLGYNIYIENVKSQSNFVAFRENLNFTLTGNIFQTY